VRRVPAGRAAAPLAALAPILVLAVVGAPDARASSARIDVGPRAPLPSALRVAAPDPLVRQLWYEGLEAEQREDLVSAAARYERIAEALPQSAFIRWRIARNYWRFAERVPVDDKEQRLHYFELADEWAGRSLALDEKCGECVLWKLAAMGRIATTSGVLKSMDLAPTIAEMIDRGIALRPQHSDDEKNSTLGNLYYAGSAFYRIVPDWFWVQWVIGVRGDKQRSLDYIRKALEISATRIDYQVELGAVLLCIGDDEADPARIDEGRRVLRAAMREELYFQSTDAVDIEHAQILIDHPDRACGYSRDGWIDLGKARR
jgi:tetratricopeptide (TPR) repeat protein